MPSCLLAGWEVCRSVSLDVHPIDVFGFSGQNQFSDNADAKLSLSLHFIGVTLYALSASM